MSSTAAPFRLRLTAAQNGTDPLTHYWFKAGRNDYRRICDGAPWLHGVRWETPRGIRCRDCCAMDAQDQLQGLRAFSLTDVPRGVFAPKPEDVLYKPDHGLSRNGAHGMRVVLMTEFARFCAAGSPVRDRMAREIAGLEHREIRNPNGALYGVLRRTHWRDGNIEPLMDATPNLDAARADYQKELARIMGLKEDYIAFWLRQAEGHFRVDPVGVTIAGLTVRVNPEVGMDTGIAKHPFKLWFRKGKMSSRHTMVYHYLLREAVENSPWPLTWIPGIWDVPRHQPSIIPNRFPAKDEDLVVSSAADFVERVRILTG